MDLSGRIIGLERRREKSEEEEAKIRKEIEEETKKHLKTINSKFEKKSNADNAALKLRTVGLETLESYKQKQEVVHTREIVDLASAEGENLGQEQRQPSKRRRLRVALSFSDEIGTEEGKIQRKETPVKKLKKNPNVETSFLHDDEREETLSKRREELKLIWMKKQENIKKEVIALKCRFWNGTNSRVKDVKVRKGNSIRDFLSASRIVFPDIGSLGADNLMAVQDETIISNNYVIYDLLISEAKGKTGIQLCNADHTVENPINIVLRSYYEKHKHIYPASQWRVFDPQRNYERRDKSLSTALV